MVSRPMKEPIAAASQIGGGTCVSARHGTFDALRYVCGLGPGSSRVASKVWRYRWYLEALVIRQWTFPAISGKNPSPLRVRGCTAFADPRLVHKLRSSRSAVGQPPPRHRRCGRRWPLLVFLGIVPLRSRLVPTRQSGHQKANRVQVHAYKTKPATYGFTL